MKIYKWVLFIFLIINNSVKSQIKLVFKDSINISLLANVNVVNYKSNYGSFSNEYGILIMPKGIYGEFNVSIIGFETQIITLLSDTVLEIKLKRKYIQDSAIVVKSIKYGKTIKIGDIKMSNRNRVTPFVGKYIFADYLKIDPNYNGILQSLKFKFAYTKFDYNNDLVEIDFYEINAEETFIEKINDAPIYYQTKNKNSKINVDLKPYKLQLNSPNLLITFKVLRESVDQAKRDYLLLIRTSDKPFPNIVASKINISSLLKSNENLKVKTEIKIKTYASN